MTQYEIIKDNMVVYETKGIKALLLGIRFLLARNITEPNIKIEIQKTEIW